MNVQDPILFELCRFIAAYTWTTPFSSCCSTYDIHLGRTKEILDLDFLYMLSQPFLTSIIPSSADSTSLFLWWILLDYSVSGPSSLNSPTSFACFEFAKLALLISSSAMASFTPAAPVSPLSSTASSLNCYTGSVTFRSETRRLPGSSWAFRSLLFCLTR